MPVPVAYIVCLGAFVYVYVPYRTVAHFALPSCMRLCFTTVPHTVLVNFSLCERMGVFICVCDELAEAGS